jgi:putative ABC transport system substrate-binding protein
MVLAITMLLAALPSCEGRRKPLRVGVVYNLEFFASTLDGFKARLAELGYREGKDIVYDIRSSGLDEISGCLEDFAAARSDLIFAFPTDVAVQAKRIGAVSGIPILFANSNIEGMNLVDSVRYPGKGITGVRYPGPDITVKRFEVMSRIAPRAKRFLVPFLRGLPILPSQLEALAPVAESKGIILIPRPFYDAAEIEAYVRSLPQSGPAPFDAVLMIVEPLMVIGDSFIPVAAYAVPRRIPMGGAMMEAGGYASLFGVSTDNVAVGRQAADLARKIFRGEAAGSIPVVSAEYSLEINLGAAERLGVRVPEGLVKLADRIKR